MYRVLKKFDCKKIIQIIDGYNQYLIEKKKCLLWIFFQL
jgi:hypothetical protein